MFFARTNPTRAWLHSRVIPAIAVVWLRVNSDPLKELSVSQDNPKTTAEFQQALSMFVERLEQDNYVLAAVLIGSIAANRKSHTGKFLKSTVSGRR